MKQNKLVYQAPEAEIFEVRSEGYLCTSGPNSVRDNSASSGYHGDDPDYDLGEI